MGVPQVVWRAAPSLSRWLDDNKKLEEFKGEVRGLELGSGTGLLGVYTAKKLIQGGVSLKFTMTDMEESVRLIYLRLLVS